MKNRFSPLWSILESRPLVSHLRLFYVVLACLSAAFALYVDITQNWFAGVVAHLLCCSGGMLLLLLWYPNLIAKIDAFVVFSFLMWMDIGFAKHWLGMDWQPIPQDTLSKATVMTLLSFSFLSIGLCSHFASDKVLLKELKQRHLFFAAGLLSFLTSAPASIYCIFFSDKLRLPLYAHYAMLGIVPSACHFAVCLVSKKDIITIIFFFASLVLVISDSSRRSLVTIFCVLFCFYLYLAQKKYPEGFPRTILVRCLIIAFFIYIGAAARRSVGWSGGTWVGFKADFTKSAWQARNLSTIPDFAFTIEEFSDARSRLHGSTIINWLLNPVPRRLWPEKPISMAKILALKKVGFMDQTKYSRELDASIRNQSYSATFIGEMWANFGWWAVIIGSFLLGVVYRFLEDLFSPQRMSIFSPVCMGSLLSAVIIQSRGDLTAANFYPECVVIWGLLSLVFAKRLCVQRRLQ